MSLASLGRSLTAFEMDDKNDPQDHERKADKEFEAERLSKERYSGNNCSRAD